MRTFVAAPVSDTILAATRDLQQWLSRGGHRLRYVSPENLHFTLKFLGEISPEDGSRLGTALASLADDFDPFQMVIGSVGGFPSMRSPRVLWVGVQIGAEQLTRLATRVETICSEQGLPGDEKPFRPHLTIARARERRPRSINLPDRILEIDLGEMTVDRVVLMRSQLGPQGAVYTPLSEIRLGGSARRPQDHPFR